MGQKNDVAGPALLNVVVQRPVVFVGGDIRTFHDGHLHIGPRVAGNMIQDHCFAAAEVLGKPGVDFL